jgi:hypothetical protein
MLHDELDADGGREVRDHVRAVRQLRDEVVVQDRPLAHLEPRVVQQVPDVRLGAGREVVEREDGVTMGEERIGQM